MASDPRHARSAACIVAVAACLLVAAASSLAADAPKPLAIRAARVLTVTKGTIENGVVVVRDGKIAAIGTQADIAVPADADVIDAGESWVMPGQIDIHTHIGNDSGLHDYVHTMNPELRIWDYVDPNDRVVQDAVASGVTTIMTIPGSGGNHAGFGVLWKAAGAPREQLIIRKLACMKVAQAYNPERRAGDIGLGRMGMWWMMRQFMASASAEVAQQTARREPQQTARREPRPPLRPDLEYMAAVYDKTAPVMNHCASGRDVFQVMSMFHDDLKLPVIVTHGEFGAFRVANEAAKRGIPVNIGPRLFDFSAGVADRKFYSIPGEYAAAGVQEVSLCTDSMVIPAEDLCMQGTLSVRLGLDEDLALRAVTINSARTIGIADRVGSLEVGKDADLVIKRGSMFEPRTPVERVIIQGRTVYVHGQRRKGYSNYLKALTGAVEADDNSGLARGDVGDDRDR